MKALVSLHDYPDFFQTIVIDVNEEQAKQLKEWANSNSRTPEGMYEFFYDKTGFKYDKTGFKFYKNIITCLENISFDLVVEVSMW